MKPICVPCQRFMRCIKNAFIFTEAMPIGDLEEDEALPGKATPDKWKPYKIWAGDLWRCPDCQAKIVVGVAPQPVSEHYKPGFLEAMAAYKPKLQVNDC